MGFSLVGSNPVETVYFFCLRITSQRSLSLTYLNLTSHRNHRLKYIGGWWLVDTFGPSVVGFTYEENQRPRSSLTRDQNDISSKTNTAR